MDVTSMILYPPQCHRKLGYELHATADLAPHAPDGLGRSLDGSRTRTPPSLISLGSTQAVQQAEG
jgi:hypothetical protein